MTGSSVPRPRVLHIFSGDLWAGAEVMIFHLLSRLHRESRVVIRAISLNDGALVANLREAGVPVLVVPESTHSFSRIALQALRHLRGETVDVIHTHRYKENALGLFLAWRLGVRSLMTTVHGLPELADGRRRRRGTATLRVRGNFLLLRYGFTQVIAVCEDMRRNLIERYHLQPERIRVIYNGIPPGDDCDQRREAGHPGFHIGSVGRLVPVKDFEFFLRVAADLRRRLPATQFSILGDGPMRDALQGIARNLHVADVVEFLPARTDPRSYYRSLDLYVNTSIHEGVPLSLLEAMACGTPVVAPRVGGIPEIVRHECEGLMPERRSPDAFADACVRILSDAELSKRMGQSARRRVVDAFSERQMAESYVSCYLGEAYRASS